MAAYMRRRALPRQEPPPMTLGEVGAPVASRHRESILFFPEEGLTSFLNQRTSMQILTGSMFESADESISSATTTNPSSTSFFSASGWPQQPFDVQRMRANVRVMAAKAWPDVFLRIPMKYAHRHHAKACEVLSFLRNKAAAVDDPGAATIINSPQPAQPSTSKTTPQKTPQKRSNSGKSTGSGKSTRGKSGKSQKVKQVTSGITFLDSAEKKLACDLAFSLKKYEHVLDEILDECCFFKRFPELILERDMVMALFFDLQERRFRPRTQMEGETNIPRIEVVEQTVTGMRIKLQAAMARVRIKHDAPSLKHLLPSHIRQMDDYESVIPLYAWINRCKASLPEVLQSLHSTGFKVVDHPSKLTRNTYMQDSDCPDLLQFHCSHRPDLPTSPLFEGGALVVQEKTTCIGPQSFLQAVQSNVVAGDILHTHVGSGRTTAHLASLLQAKQETPRRTIYAFGAGHKINQLQHFFRQLGMDNVMVFRENFTRVNPHDQRWENVTAVYVTPPSSNCNVINPVDFVCNEDVDMSLLNAVIDHHQGQNMARKLFSDQVSILEHALAFPRVYLALYQTYSRLDVENQMVIDSTLCTVNNKYRDAIAKRHKDPDRIVTEKPPDDLFILEPIEAIGNIVSSSNNTNIEESSSIDDRRYFTVKPSETGSGCFLAMLKRTATVKLSARAIIEEAQAKGLLTGLHDSMRIIEEESMHTKKTDDASSGKMPKRLQRLVEPTQSFLHKQNTKKLIQNGPFSKNTMGAQRFYPVPGDQDMGAAGSVGTATTGGIGKKFNTAIPACPRHSRHHHEDSEMKTRFVAQPVNPKILKPRMDQMRMQEEANRIARRCKNYKGMGMHNLTVTVTEGKAEENLYSLMATSIAASVATQMFGRSKDGFEKRRKLYPVHTLRLDGGSFFDHE